MPERRLPSHRTEFKTCVFGPTLSNNSDLQAMLSRKSRCSGVPPIGRTRLLCGHGVGGVIEATATYFVRTLRKASIDHLDRSMETYIRGLEVCPTPGRAWSERESSL